MQNLCPPTCSAKECVKEECDRACIAYAKEHCNNANIIYDPNNRIVCINMAKDWRDTSQFYISEVDVIE